MRPVNEETRAKNERVVQRLTEQGKPAQFILVAPGVFAGFPKLTENPVGFIAVGTCDQPYYSDAFLEVAAELESKFDPLFASEHPNTGDFTFWRLAA